MREIIATILLMLATSAHAEFKLDSIDDLQNALKINEPQGVGLALGYLKGIQDGIMMMVVYQKSEDVKFNFIGPPDRKFPTVIEMVKLLKEHKDKYPTHGDLPLEHMILTTLMDNHYLEKEKISKTNTVLPMQTAKLPTTLSQERLSKIQNILRVTLAADGYITKAMHDEFWDEMKQIGSENEINKTVPVLKANMLYVKEYQKELWESAKISYKNKKVIKTQKLLMLEKELPTKFEESLPYPKGSRNYSIAVNASKANGELSDKDSILLEAAAAHKQATFPQGQVADVNEDLINTILVNIDSSIERVQQLLTENWPVSKKELYSKADNEVSNNDVPDFVKEFQAKQNAPLDINVGYEVKNPYQIILPGGFYSSQSLEGIQENPSFFHIVKEKFKKWSFI